MVVILTNVTRQEKELNSIKIIKEETIDICRQHDCIENS